jgi:hypothetical protein
MSKVSQLIQDLNSVPNIVGGLGLSIAAAQKALNLDYLENVERLVALAKIVASRPSTDAGDPSTATAPNEFRAFLKEMVAALAPPRYQFTETTLSVRLDLAQTLDRNTSVGLGVGYGAVALNAAYSVGYGYDYRAAAECRAVIHAIPPDPAVFRPLLDRAASLGKEALALPDRTEVDDRIIQQARTLTEKLLGEPAPKVTP